MAHPSSRSRAKTAVRVLLIGFLAVLLAVVFVFLSRRSDRPAAIRPETRPLTTQKVDVKENIHFVKDTGGRNILDVQAARNFTDAVGLYHLKGPEGEKGGGVRVESRARDGQLKFAAFAEEVIYDADWTRLVFRGGVEIRLDDLTVKGASFTYHKNRDAVVTNVPAVFEGRRFRGDCRRATYNVTDEYFVFSGGITLVTAPWDDDPVPVIITGKSMTYARQPRTGEIRGDVRIAHGRSRGRCNDVFFAQFPDKPEFRLFDFHGNVKWEADERAVPAAVPAKPKAGEASPADDELIFFQGGRQRMEAGSMMFVPYGTEGWARYGSMQGGARVDILGEAGRQTTLEARDTVFFMMRVGLCRRSGCRPGPGSGVRRKAECGSWRRRPSITAPIPVSWRRTGRRPSRPGRFRGDGRSPPNGSPSISKRKISMRGAESKSFPIRKPETPATPPCSPPDGRRS
jgi:hypothetical protein